MADEKKIQLTLTNEKLIEKIEKDAAYGFSSRREFICAAVLAYESPLTADVRMEKFAKEFAREMTRIFEKREEEKRHENLANEFL